MGPDLTPPKVTNIDNNAIPGADLTILTATKCTNTLSSLSIFFFFFFFFVWNVYNSWVNTFRVLGIYMYIHRYTFHLLFSSWVLSEWVSVQFMYFVIPSTQSISKYLPSTYPGIIGFDVLLSGLRCNIYSRVVHSYSENVY